MFGTDYILSATISNALCLHSTPFLWLGGLFQGSHLHPRRLSLPHFCYLHSIYVSPNPAQELNEKHFKVMSS